MVNHCDIKLDFIGKPVAKFQFYCSSFYHIDLMS